MKHLGTKQLWMQEKVRVGALRVVKVPRSRNISDALTHFWTKAEGDLHFKHMNISPAYEVKTSMPRGGA